MDFANYKFRCSYLGNIVNKSGNITQTTKTYLLELWIKERFNVEKDIASKYFDKGVACESDGRELLQKTFYKNEFVAKNKTRLENDYLQGEYDYYSKTDETVTDIKNAWDIFTFHKAKLTHDYEWQLKGYAMLLGINKCRLFYFLNDMPDFMLCEEERKLFGSGKFLTTESQDFLQACDELKRKFTYSYLRTEERFKFWHFNANENDFEKIRNSVEQARKYLIALDKTYLDNLEGNAKIIVG